MARRRHPMEPSCVCSFIFAKMASARSSSFPSSVKPSCASAALMTDIGGFSPCIIKYLAMILHLSVNSVMLYDEPEYIGACTPCAISQDDRVRCKIKCARTGASSTMYTPCTPVPSDHEPASRAGMGLKPGGNGSARSQHRGKAMLPEKSDRGVHAPSWFSFCHAWYQVSDTMVSDRNY